MGKGHGAQHFFFGQLIGFGFDHHHGVFGAGDNQIKPLFGLGAQVVHVVDFGVQDVLTIHETHAAGTDWAHEGRAGNRQRSGCRDHRDHVGVVDAVKAQHGTHHQNFVLEAGDEQRADRAVDQAGCQRLFFCGTRFALEKSHLALCRRRNIFSW